MLKNYITITIRNLLRNRVYSTINIVGLSLGLACAMLIILYTKDELSYDRFHSNGPNIYRIVHNRLNPDGSTDNMGGNTGPFQGPKFSAYIPEIESFVRFNGAHKELKQGNYEAEAKWKQMMLFGAIVTIFISCIGLFGLFVLSAEKRTKEARIRKILSASVTAVVFTLSKDFLKLIAIALIIAMPAAQLFTNKWLENYPYRIGLDWKMFAATGFLVVVLSLITVSFQVVRAAIANPVDSLRNE